MAFSRLSIIKSYIFLDFVEYINYSIVDTFAVNRNIINNYFLRLKADF